MTSTIVTQGRQWLLAGVLGAWTILASAAPPAVQTWVTTGDQRKLMSHEPDLAIGAAPAGGMPAAAIQIDAGTRYQTMVGFGAAITDASAWLIQTKMSAPQRAALMRELFAAGTGADAGLGLSFTRLTIGASDFSRTHYSFDDVGPGESDPRMTRFSIEANRADVLPVVKSALALNPSLRVMASPWSAPAWMKSGDSLIKGKLKPAAYDAFALYLSRYVDAYAAEGVPIFALTLQNEPHFEPKDYPGMRVDPAARALFIGGHLGPLLAKTHPETKIFDWDHNWDEAESPTAVLTDPAAAKYIDAVAWHCYKGDVKAQTPVRDVFPAKDVYFTECSGGEWAPVWADNLQHFVGTLVIGTTRGWAKGVLLWNLALDENYGPHLGGCRNCRGIVTINSATGAVTRNVEYYALAHASRFVRQGAQRVGSTGGEDGVTHVAFRNSDDGSLVLIVANAARQPRNVTVRDGARQFATTMAAGSVATFAWQ